MDFRVLIDTHAKWHDFRDAGDLRVLDNGALEIWSPGPNHPDVTRVLYSPAHWLRVDVITEGRTTRPAY